MRHQLQPTHARHTNIRNDNIKIAMAQLIECLQAVARRRDFEAATPQSNGGREEDATIIINEKDGSHNYQQQETWIGKKFSESGISPRSAYCKANADLGVLSESNIAFKTSTLRSLWIGQEYSRYGTSGVVFELFSAV